MQELFKSFDTIGIIIFVVSSATFRLGIAALSRSNPEIFSFVDKIPDSLKGKWYIRWGTFIALVFILSIIVVGFNFSGNLSWIIAGFISAFTDFIFFKPNGGN